ncbi:MAG: FAD binding domain-containing protein [Fidelibacterota bacterium]
MDELFSITSRLSHEEYILLAGGTDLVPRFKLLRQFPSHLIDIKHLTMFRGIAEYENEIVIGALTDLESIRTHGGLKTQFPALTQAADEFAGIQIRHRATIGGNICNASPAGDLLPGLYAANASLSIRSGSGSRTIPIGDFITGPGKTRLNPGELVTSIHIPRTSRKSMFYKLGLRQSMAISVVNLAVTWDGNAKEPGEFIIAAGSVAPTVVFLKKFTDALNKNNRDLTSLLPFIDQDIFPITDIRASETYRRKVLKNIVKFEIKKILDSARV